MSWVSIHAPARGATLTAESHPCSRRSFNSRSREGSDPINPAYESQEIPFQFTLPRGERPPPSSRLRWWGVSIHAPARGATNTYSDIPHNICFNSRSREGSDCFFDTATNLGHCFNSRSREGSDCQVPLLCLQGRVSIHAPARGATFGATTLTVEEEVSIHAPARGATRVLRVWMPSLAFQFTLPRGERRNPSFRSRICWSFNSRSREGSDLWSQLQFCPSRCFNSRSREGSDSNGCGIAVCNSPFQFTLPRGERRWLKSRTARVGSSFNSRSREGSDYVDGAHD